MDLADWLNCDKIYFQTPRDCSRKRRGIDPRNHICRLVAQREINLNVGFKDSVVEITNISGAYILV